MTVKAAEKDPTAQGYYAESYGRGRFRAARAWMNAGVIDFNEDLREFEYTEEYQK
jgi:hypothetical protein